MHCSHLIVTLASPKLLTLGRAKCKNYVFPFALLSFYRNFADAMNGNKQILLIGDLVSYGKLATQTMAPILSHLGFSSYTLPTALVSNNFGYGNYALLDTTDYMRQAFDAWQKLGFNFDAVATGFISSLRQAQLVADFCKQLAAKGTPIFVDPIMADGGTLYSGMPATMPESFMPIISLAHVTCPNYTEACLLTGRKYQPAGMSRQQAEAMVCDLHAMGPHSVVVTSIPIDGKPSVVGFDGTSHQHFLITYDELPIQFSGTGDIFSAVLIGRMLSGHDLKTATKMAVDVVYNLIDANKDAQDPYKGIIIEQYLDHI